MTQKYEAIQEYEVEIAASRQHFEHQPAVRTVCYEEIDSNTLAAILIYFSALGVAMTEPVGRWIRRAGERCGTLGLPVLAKALAAHAQHEEGHHRLMESDTRHLVRLWNEQHEPKLDAGELLALDHTAGVVAYRALHDDVIAGSTPYGQ